QRNRRIARRYYLMYLCSVRCLVIRAALVACAVAMGALPLSAQTSLSEIGAANAARNEMMGGGATNTPPPQQAAADPNAPPTAVPSVDKSALFEQQAQTLPLNIPLIFKLLMG